jgi:hypothetical protein
MLCTIEKNLNIFEHKVCGILIWEVIRRNVWRKLAFTEERKNRSPRTRASLLKLVRRIVKMGIVAFDIVFFNRWQQKKSYSYPYIFYGPGTGRRKLRDDGFYWDIYCDPIIDELSVQNCLVIEKVNREDDYKLDALKSQNVFLRRSNSVGVLDAIASIISLLRMRKEEFLPLRNIENEIFKNIQQRIDVLAISKKYLFIFISERRYWRRFLKKSCPKLIFLVCSYGNEAFISAAKELDIPVVELQHGEIDKIHVGYSFPLGKQKKNFPDYIFSYGNFWKKSAFFPIDEECVISIGNPWFELTKPPSDSELVKKKQILFISSPPVGAKLSQQAAKLRSLIPESWNIIYKLHPREIRDWKNAYSCLDVDGIDVVDKSSVDLYKLQSESTIQIGVFSSALYEGVALGCETFILDLEGWQHVRLLIECGAATKISDCSEISLEVDKNNNKVIVELEQHMFSTEWQNNLKQALKNILAV